jgi:RNase P subunit RPR2
MSIFRPFFSRVTYTCHQCGARQRIPLRRIHVFERFQELKAGEPVLIACPLCENGLQTPSAYRTHTGHHVIVDPEQPPRNAFIHANY